MTQLIGMTDAVTRGELQFAIVETFNADTEPAEGSIGYAADKPYYGDGSRDMTGTVRLMDGTILPFAYVDGRYAIRENDGTIHWDEEGYSPANGGRGMSWPFESFPVMVEVVDGSVRRWTWPGVILCDNRYICDPRYLESPNYDCEVRFAGLHCLVDISKLTTGWAEELVKEPRYDFPGAAVYIGHHADDFLARSITPYAYAVFGWDKEDGKSRLVSILAKLT
ncbi:MAG TPA: hypothetical protein VLI05_00325 [Candidatus Saccharimonadia bacterium]|nr:hypothetical protein [Candidatus Saccharimonadia bacterium]